MKQAKREQTENRRIHGNAIDTKLSTLPERFTFGPHTEVMSKYLSRRWYATSYGWYKRSKEIEYNQEWTPHVDNTVPRYRLDDRRFRWVEYPANGLRFIGKAHEIRGSGDGNIPYFDRSLVEHHGWYTDSFQDETVCGEVYQLPARNGVSQYVPAIEDKDNDGAILDFHSITDDMKDAVRWSDSMAERFAEDEREYQLRTRAEERIEEIKEEVSKSRAEFKALARELRANCDKVTGMTELQKLVRRAYKSMRRECRKLLAESRRLADDYHAIHPDY
jgi:hypothetical protein